MDGGADMVVTGSPQEKVNWGQFLHESVGSWPVVQQLPAFLCLRSENPDLLTKFELRCAWRLMVRGHRALAQKDTLRGRRASRHRGDRKSCLL